MSYRLPSLTALRAFEAAARHLSFKQAANELHVTPGAVGQQIKGLEEALGVQLFQRLHRSLLLTEAGQAYLPPIQTAFRHISEATSRLVPERLSQSFDIGVQPAFAVKWLMPRLPRFAAAYPAIKIRLSTASPMEELLEGRVDAAICPGLGHQPGMTSDFIFSEAKFPVCSPALLDAEPPLRDPCDLQHHILLHDEYREDWPAWLALHGVQGVEATQGLSFSDEKLLIQAAIDGQGVALGRQLWMDRELAEGRLIQPFATNVTNDLAYYLFYPEGRADCVEITAFRHWVLNEARSSPTYVGRSDVVVD